VSKAATATGIGLADVLTVIFVVLKLTHLIAWSWWWVLSPQWIGTAIWLACLLIVAVGDAIDHKRRA